MGRDVNEATGVKVAFKCPRQILCPSDWSWLKKPAFGLISNVVEFCGLEGLPPGGPSGPAHACP